MACGRTGNSDKVKRKKSRIEGEGDREREGFYTCRDKERKIAWIEREDMCQRERGHVPERESVGERVEEKDIEKSIFFFSVFYNFSSTLYVN